MTKLSTKGIHIWTVTAVQPFSNFGAELPPGSSVSPLQKLSFPEGDRVIVSGQAVRAMLRDRLSETHEINRVRPPTGTFHSHQAAPDPKRFADDFCFGYLIPEKANERKGERRRSLFDVSISVGTSVLTREAETTFHQAPDNSSLYQQETVVTAFVTAYRFRDSEWFTPRGRELLPDLLRAVVDPGPVGGKHARSSYSWSPVKLLAIGAERASLPPMIGYDGEMADHPAPVGAATAVFGVSGHDDAVTTPQVAIGRVLEWMYQ